MPLEVKQVTGMSLNADWEIRKTPRQRDLALATRQMATMLDAGLNYLEAIDVVRKDCEDAVLANALAEVRHQINGGSSFAKALAAQPNAFPPVMVNLVTAGEAAGRVKESMITVADSMDAADQLRAKIKKAMMYPVIVSILSAVVFGFMMLYLVPKFAATFEDLGGPGTKLPFLTQVVVTASEYMKIGIPAFLVLTVPVFFWYRANKNKERVREVMDPLKLRIPIFGNLFHKMALERFTRDLAGLMGAGVERLEALSIAAKTCGNIQMERAVLAARDAQRQGRPLVEPLKDEPLFPQMLIQMVEAGERSGKTAFMLQKASKIYARDVDQITDNLAALIEPLFLVMLGGMVGVLVIAIYLPYLNIGEVISG